MIIIVLLCRIEIMNGKYDDNSGSIKYLNKHYLTAFINKSSVIFYKDSSIKELKFCHHLKD